ncbi:MAG: hypothetical protein LQ351_004141 [Letrouitia transgressa]|nr:MAG: hypothetical protein LQ351_004141 [Letrouitia transgressa]
MSQADEWNDSHRAFLQAFIARSTLTFQQAKPLIASIQTVHERKEVLSEDITEADFNSYIFAVNTRISPFDLQIRSSFHQSTRERICALVNTTSDPIIQLATTHSPDEISFLKRVLDAMFETYNTPRHEVMAITSMQAVKLHKSPDDRRETQNGSTTQGSSGQGLKVSEAEKMLKTLVDEGWFEKSKKGFYSLTPRALMELKGWLIDTYNDLDDEEDEDEERPLKIKQCVACKEIVTMGQRCPKRNCACRIHDICTQNFFRMQRNRNCPACKTEWTGTDFVGERAAVKANKRGRNGRTSTPDTSRITTNGVDEDDEDNEDG